MEYPAHLTDTNIPYILIIVDVTSRYAFYSFLDGKARKSVLDGFKNILNQIQKKRKSCSFTSETNMTFYSDFGTEFTNPKLAEFLLKRWKSLIFNSGTPKIKKLGMFIY